MDESIFLYSWFSFDLQYHLILVGTNNVLHSSVKKILCTLWSLALAKKSCYKIINSRAQVSCDYGVYVVFQKILQSRKWTKHD